MFRALATATLVMLAAPAAALTTISVDQTVDGAGQSFYTTSQTFSLSAGFTNASLNIGSFIADDAAIVLVNGTAITGTGIFGPGNGFFFFDPAGPSTPYAFAYGNGAVNASFSAPFVVGTNTISIIVNNNNAGINTGNGGLTGGPTNLAFTGTVTFDAAPGVPEPANWMMLIAGFAMVGAAARRRVAMVA